MARPASSAESPATSSSPITLAEWSSSDARRPITLRLMQLLARERTRVALILLVTLAQGILYMALLPAWQHYDEPTHFEYAWLIANKTWFPKPGDEDATMRRAVASSMLEHNFYWNQSQPQLLSDYREVWIGVIELNHPPAYYMLVALPLRLLRYIDITSQLYVARSVSLVLFLLTVAVAVGLMRELTPRGHMLRWAVPLAMALTPPFADAMTSVNSDVGAIVVYSLFLWGCVRTIVRGLSVGRVLWVLGMALLAAVTKNTAAIAVVFAPIALLAAGWRQAGWRWRWLGAIVAGGVVMLLLAVLAWGDAAYWYRVSFGPAQTSDTQRESPAAVVGTHVLVLEADPGEPPRQLISPLLADDVAQLAGQMVTIGGWFWSDQPDMLASSSLSYGTANGRDLQNVIQQIGITTKPTFIAWTFKLPADTRVLQYVLSVDMLPTVKESRHIYSDGALLVAGAYPVGVTPQFDDADAQSGTWDGRRFTNVIRNASAERSWPHLRPWLDHLLERYLHRSPAQTVASVFDMQRNAGVLLGDVVSWVLYAFFGVFAWGHVSLQGWGWRVLFQGLALLALLGVGRFFARRSPPNSALWVSLIFLGCTGALIWMNTLLRPLPLLNATILYPVARYGFPCIIPTALAFVGGTGSLVSPRWRGYVVGALIGGLLVLNVVAVQTVWSFYRSLPL